jgi:DNA-binding NarL/FixJ family response regulator
MSVRVLLVDDHDETRTILAKWLKRNESIELLAAVPDAPAANTFAESPLDLVLVDLHSTNGEDHELCRSVGRAIRAPLVVLASFMTDERWTRLQEVGASRYLLRHVGGQGLAEDVLAVAGQLAKQTGS